VRRRAAGAAARRRDSSLEALDLAHPVFAAVRPWYARLGGDVTLEALNRLADEAGVRTATGRALRFVRPEPADPYYEIKVHETGCVQTRPGSLHDLFNALAWLAFPRTKASINARHAAAIPREQGRRGRLRDLLTIFDEGGAIVSAPPGLRDAIKAFRWKELFWHRREEVLRCMRIHVLGHAVLEQALKPWPGITCKVVFAGEADDPDIHADAWLGALAADATPREMAPLPIFGYPGWLSASDHAAFYEDQRYFRPFRRDLPL
jgi:hypothetical protein